MTLLLAILAAGAIPQAAAGLDRSRAQAATRYVAARMALARQQAVTRAVSVSIRFGASHTGYQMTMFADGNRNGVRSRDIAAGIDRPIADAEKLGDLFPGVSFGVVEGTGIRGSPIRISSNLLTFTPFGTATAGSVYVLGRDGSQLAVRVLGATARTRIQRYVPGRHAWVAL